MTRVPAISFEVRKIAWRQSKEGLVVSFVIHPDDVNADFAVAALGTRYMVALAKIGDDEQPEPIRQQMVSAPANDRPPSNPSEARTPGEGEGVGSAPKEPAQQYKGVPSDRTKRHWSELSLPEQIGIRCQEKRFREWMYARFEDQATDIADAVRQHCNVKSRAEIQPGTEAATLWFALEADFLAATGQMAEERR